MAVPILVDFFSYLERQVENCGRCTGFSGVYAIYASALIMGHLYYVYMLALPRIVHCTLFSTVLLITQHFNPYNYY